jgi:hypothetical protein
LLILNTVRMAKMARQAILLYKHYTTSAVI